jgi:uncharacterized HAD superfamily protein
MSHEPDHLRLMRDEQIGKTQISLQIFEEIQYLSLYRDIQSRCRLVQDYYLRAEEQYSTQGHFLTLSARDLSRITAKQLFRQANHMQHLFGPILPFSAGNFKEP